MGTLSPCRTLRVGGLLPNSMRGRQLIFSDTCNYWIWTSPDRETNAQLSFDYLSFILCFRSERNLFLVSLVRRESQAIHLRHETTNWFAYTISEVNSKLYFPHSLHRTIQRGSFYGGVLAACRYYVVVTARYGEDDVFERYSKTINAHWRDHPNLTNKSRYLNRMWGKLSSSEAYLGGPLGHGMMAWAFDQKIFFLT